MSTAVCTLRQDVTAVAVGLTMLCVGTVALIGAGGLVLWIAGVM
ncbi:MAG: hypothetical protein ACM33T_08350 [Solirubrobacterales bacterium]